MPLTVRIGTFLTILFNFFENPNTLQTIPVPKPVDITMLGVQLAASEIVPIVFCGCTGNGKLNFNPNIIFVIPKHKKMPAGFSPTMDIYPIINGINVPQSPKAPPNSLIESFLIFLCFVTSIFKNSNNYY